MTSLPSQSKQQFGYMKIAFVITFILSVFLTLSVWSVLHGIFKKELRENSEKHEALILEPTKTNAAFEKEISEMKVGIVTKVDAFNSFKMDEIDSQFEAAKRMKKDKEDKEKPVPVEEKELPENPVFKLSELGPLLELKDAGSILENQISKDFSLDKLKGKPLNLNDSLVDFVNKKKDEISKSENYKLEFGKKWVADLKREMEKDKKLVFDQLGITDIKKNEINFDGLKNLLLNTDIEKYNLYFAYEYFKKTDLEAKIQSQQEWPGIPFLSEENKKKMADKSKKRDEDIAHKKAEYLGYLGKYEAFLESLKKENK